MINKTLSFVIASSALYLASCTSTTAVNSPGYRTNYVYSNAYVPPAYEHSENYYKVGMGNRWYGARPYYNESVSYSGDRWNSRRGYWYNQTSAGVGYQTNSKNYQYNQVNYNSAYRPMSSSQSTSVQSSTSVNAAQSTTSSTHVRKAATPSGSMSVDYQHGSTQTGGY